MTNKVARYVNMVLGSWVLLSAFVWRHDGVQFLATVLAGAVVVAIAPFGLFAARARILTLASGAALAAAALLLPHQSMATTWNNAIVGVAIAAVALVGPRITTHLSSTAYSG